MHRWGAIFWFLAGFAAVLRSAPVHAQAATRPAHASVIVTLGAGARGGEIEGGATSFALSTGLELRLHHASGHGGALRFQYLTPMNACSTYVDFYVTDAAYAFRAAVLQSPALSLVVRALAGVTFIAGERQRSSETCADVATQTGPLLSGADDHMSIGGVVGGAMDLQFGTFLIGFGADLRYAPVVASQPNDADRTLVLQLRFGTEFTL